MSSYPFTYMQLTSKYTNAVHQETRLLFAWVLLRISSSRIQIRLLPRKIKFRTTKAHHFPEDITNIQITERNFPCLVNCLILLVGHQYQFLLTKCSSPSAFYFTVMSALLTICENTNITFAAVMNNSLS